MNTSTCFQDVSLSGKSKAKQHVQLLQKTVQENFKKLKIELPYDLVYTPKELKLRVSREDESRWPGRKSSEDLN
jgi:hypothetical protein